MPSDQILPSVSNSKTDPATLNDYSNYSSYLSDRLDFTVASENSNTHFIANATPKFKCGMAYRIKRIKWNNNSFGKELNKFEAWLYVKQNP